MVHGGRASHDTKAHAIQDIDQGQVNEACSLAKALGHYMLQNYMKVIKTKKHIDLMFIVVLAVTERKQICIYVGL